MVTRLTLDQVLQVRVLDPQPLLSLPLKRHETPQTGLQPASPVTPPGFSFEGAPRGCGGLGEPGGQRVAVRALGRVAAPFR